jgi:hypothetical protein
MDELFVSQFEDQNGFIVYQRLSFVLPWLSRGTPVIVTAAERDRFIAEFTAESPAIMRRMMIDIFIAFGSFVVTSEFFHAVFGEYATSVELTLLLTHLIAIVVAVNRRLGLLWDAPLRATVGRAPAPFAPQRRRGLIKPVERMTNQELVAGIVTGLICAGCAGIVLGSPRASEVPAFTYYTILALFAAIVVLGIRCGAEAAVRLLGWLKA